MLSGELKSLVAEKISQVLAELREKREIATEKYDATTAHRNPDPHPASRTLISSPFRIPAMSNEWLNRSLTDSLRISDCFLVEW